MQDTEAIFSAVAINTTSQDIEDVLYVALYVAYIGLSLLQ